MPNSSSPMFLPLASCDSLNSRVPNGKAEVRLLSCFQHPLQKCLLESESLPTLCFPQSSIPVSDLRHPHLHLALPLYALERAVLPGKDACHQTPGFLCPPL